MADNTSPAESERRLADIIRKVKMAAADREDVVVDIREADRARLEVLAEELSPVLAAVPDDVDLFDFTISSGMQPRFWVDAVAHVHMAADRRTYRFVRDTRLGRVVVAEASEVAPTADAVARYIAERLVERERFLAGDTGEAGIGRATGEAEDRAVRAEAQADAGKELPPVPAAAPASVFLVALLWFVLGLVAGAGLFLAAYWDRLAIGFR